MENSGFRKSNSAKSTLSLTGNDAKILGRFLETKREKCLPAKQFETRLFKTHNSNWTPVVHRPSNDRIFKERKDLIMNWFDLWTGPQRRDFFDTVLLHCTNKQLFHIQNWFVERVPLQHLDFTTVLPRFLSLYIFSFLDPRSLSRASKVSWHWKFLAEQDVVWMSKCLIHGWFLPYTPSPYEYGAWKHHYVACCLSLDAETGGENASRIRKNLSTKNKTLSKSRLISTRKALRLLWPDIRQEILLARPPWLPPDRFPLDLENSRKALLSGFDPNDPKIDPALLMYHTKFGTWTDRLRYSAPALVAARLVSDARRSEHHLLAGPETMNDSEIIVPPISQNLKLENLEERRIMELRGMTSDPPRPSLGISERRPALSGGAEYPLPWAKLAVNSGSRNWSEHPRILLISSRVAAVEMLVDAALIEVISIVYDYDSATIESLLYRLDQALRGRRAKSIGIFTHVNDPGKICLLRGADVSSENFVGTPEFLHFFQQTAIHAVETVDGGHVDLFLPLLASEPGTQLVSQLTLRTGVIHSAASGVRRGNNFLNSEWSATLDGSPPPSLYFSSNKLTAWIKFADHIGESCIALAQMAGKYFGKNNRDVIARVVGETVFETSGLTKLGDLEAILRAVVDGLAQTTQEFEVKDPLLSLADYLRDQSHRKNLNHSDGESNEPFANSYGPGRNRLSKRLERESSFEEQPKRDGDRIQNSKDTEDEEISDDIQSSDEFQATDNFETTKDFLDAKKSVSFSTASVNFNRYSHRKEFEPSVSWRNLNEISLGVDRRSSVVQEILSTEIDYLRTLEVIQNCFYSPCRAALDANRAIISASNVEVIFKDILLLTEISSGLVSDLRLRLSGWHLQQCIGDIFVKFGLKLKAYSNFIRVYPTILRAIEKCVDQFPLFRAFLKRHECTAESKMLTLPELFLSPSRRIPEFISLLTFYQHETPRDHSDHPDVELALDQLMEINRLIQESECHFRQEKQLLMIQKTIIKCPILLEANRFLIKELDVSGLLRPSSEEVTPTLRVYRHVENLGLYLFNDCLVVTKRTSRYVPFRRSKEEIHTFSGCCELIRLRVEEIPDSKYISNAFRMFTPNREWLCSVETSEDKIEWISILEKTIRAALEDLD